VKFSAKHSKHYFDKSSLFPGHKYDDWEELVSGGHEQPWRPYSHVILFCPEGQAMPDPFLVVETRRIAHQVVFDWEKGDSTDERMRPQELVFEAHGAWGADERAFMCFLFIKIAGKPHHTDFDRWICELRSVFYNESNGLADIWMSDDQALDRYQEMVSHYHRLAIGTCHLRTEMRDHWDRIGTFGSNRQ
jgi:hypothetical protein